jgi:hypothetical protein
LLSDDPFAQTQTRTIVFVAATVTVLILLAQAERHPRSVSDSLGTAAVAVLCVVFAVVVLYFLPAGPALQTLTESLTL